MTFRVLLTGASGFVGSHVLRHLIARTDWEIVCPTTFHHKGLPARIASAICDQPGAQERVKIIHWDMRSHADMLTRREIGEPNVFMNIASESHVDRSIQHPVPFIENNVQLMLRALELARITKPRLFLQMSTDEVYGPAPVGDDHMEWSPIVPSNPYSASKAAQEAIAISYWRTYDVPLVITNTMNIIGEMQDPEKFVPKIIRSLRTGEQIDVHVDDQGQPGSRFYLHARNLADAWLHLVNRDLYQGDVLHRHSKGWVRPNRFNIVGESEIHNDEMVYAIGNMMGMDHYAVEDQINMVNFHGSRPGHDLRYALDGGKIIEYDWQPPVPLWESLDRTVKWTLEHPEWLEL